MHGNLPASGPYNRTILHTRHQRCLADRLDRPELNRPYHHIRLQLQLQPRSTPCSCHASNLTTRPRQSLVNQHWWKLRTDGSSPFRTPRNIKRCRPSRKSPEKVDKPAIRYEAGGGAGQRRCCPLEWRLLGCWDGRWT
jgi:hypothetical protein